MGEASATALKDTLKKCLVETLPHTKCQIVSVTTDTQLLEAFKELITQRVQSAPVWDVNTSAWIGWLELRDLVSFCVAESSPEKHGEQPLCGGHASAASAGPSLHHWLMKRADIEMPADVDETASKERPHKQVAYLAKRNRVRTVQAGQSLPTAIHELAARGVHRLALVEPSDPLQITNIISQTSVLSFLYREIENIGDSVKQTVAELQLGTRPCISVKATDSALEALTVMDKYNLNSVAVVDEGDGSLVANTSGSDLGVFLSGRNSLHMPVLDFFAESRKADLSEKASTRSPTVTCTDQDTLQKVIGRLAKTRMHHIYIVDQQKVPLGVISVSDICRLLDRECCKP